MRKLLSANFFRLWRDRTFWLGMIFMSGLGTFVVYSQYSDMIRYGGHALLDSTLFVYILFSGLCSAVFCSLSAGTDYSDGTIRNKIVVGHLRTSIYLSNWLTNITAAILMSAVFLLSYCTLGSFLLEAPGTPPKQLLFYIAASIFTVAAYTAVFHMLAMLITKRSVSAVSCLLVFFGLLILAMVIKSKLDAPEFISPYSLTINGVEQLEPEPNPKYLQPAARKVYQLFLDILPTGQSIQLSALNVPNPFIMMLASAVICVLTTIFGILIFKRKNIK